jgi:hypothetical protein
LGQYPTPKGAPAAKSLPNEDKPDRPILPTSVSWAKAAVGARAHSPPQDRRQSIPSSVSQPSPVRTPTPPPVTPVAAEPEPTTAELITPSDISLSLATSDEQSRNAMRMFDKILENFQYGSFEFSFSTELLDTEDFKLATQESPYFQFKTPEATEDGDFDSGDSDSKEEMRYSPKSKGFDPFASTIDNAPKRQESRFAYVNDPLSQVLAQPNPSTTTQTQLVRSFSPPRMTDPILAQQIQPTQSTSQFKTATPPPPGMYFSHAQQYDLQRRQQLLESQQRIQNFPANPDYGYYPQVQSSMRNYSSYDDDHSVYAPQARRHLLDNQGSSLRRL